MTSELRFKNPMMQLRVLFAAIFLLITGFVNAAESNPEQAARAALDGFLVDWNRSDLVALQEHLSFPHVTHGPGRLIGKGAHRAI